MRAGHHEYHNFQDQSTLKRDPDISFRDNYKEAGVSECHNKSKVNMESKLDSFPFRNTLFRIFLIATIAMQVCAQYEPQQQNYDRYGSSHMMAPGGYGGGVGHGAVGGYEQGGESEPDERPRIHVGFRLRIPAFRFELPRFNLPKITVNAKIRQPNRPRVITLPEINLDTSSKVAPEGAAGNLQAGHNGGGGGGYGGYSSSSQSHANYYPKPQGGTSENEFTFTTSGDDSDHGNSGHTATGGYANRYQYGPQQLHQQRHNQANYGNAMSQTYSRPQQQPAYHMQPNQQRQNYERPNFNQHSNYAMISASQQSSTRMPPTQNDNANPYIGFDDDRRK